MSPEATALSKETIEIIKSTVPVLEEHGEKITSRFYELMFDNHPELLNIFNHTNQKQGRQPKALAQAVHAAAQYIDNLEAILPVVKQIGHKHRSLGVTSEQYPLVGKHLLLAIRDVLGDAATEEVISAWTEAYGVIAGAFIGVEAQMYQQVENQEGGWEGFRRFVVDRKVKESEVITSFYLKAEDQGAIAGFIPGQYVSVKVKMAGEEFTHMRQYSLSDAPGKGYYRISVKREAGSENADGLVSNYLHDHVSEGGVLEISAPAGDFILDLKKHSPLVLISGGIGLTPMMSMLKTVTEMQPERDVTFVHGAENSLVHAFHEEVEALVNDKVKLFVFYTSPTREDHENKSHDVEGHISAGWLEQNVDLQNSDFYFCGPVPFMKKINRYLKDLGVSDDRIHFEFFGPMGNLVG